MLGDAAGLFFGDGCFPDVIKKGGFAMINMTHNDDDGRARCSSCSVFCFSSFGHVQFSISHSLFECLFEHALFLIGKRMLGCAAMDFFSVDPDALPGVETREDYPVVLAVEERYGKTLVPASVLEGVKSHETDLLDGDRSDGLERSEARLDGAKPFFYLGRAAERVPENIVLGPDAFPEDGVPPAVEVKYEPGDGQKGDAKGNGNEKK